MGIEVRQAVLKYAAENSSQLIMFLTGSEILGVENLIDEYAGRVYTFTNSAHYPSKLVKRSRLIVLRRWFAIVTIGTLANSVDAELRLTTLRKRGWRRES